MAKFRTVRQKCWSIVRAYREANDDWRTVPEFHLGCHSNVATKGEIQLMRREKKGEEPIFSESIAYNSVAELAWLMENLGNAWAKSNASRNTGRTNRI